MIACYLGGFHTGLIYCCLRAIVLTVPCSVGLVLTFFVFFDPPGHLSCFLFIHFYLVAYMRSSAPNFFCARPIPATYATLWKIIKCRHQLLHILNKCSPKCKNWGKVPVQRLSDHLLQVVLGSVPHCAS